MEVQLSKRQVEEGMRTAFWKAMQAVISERYRELIRQLIDHEDEAVRGAIRELEYVSNLPNSLMEEVEVKEDAQSTD